VLADIRSTIDFSLKQQQQHATTAFIHSARHLIGAINIQAVLTTAATTMHMRYHTNQHCI
jgi:hypothetical protein